MPFSSAAGTLLSAAILLYLLASLAPFPPLMRRQRPGHIVTPALATAGLVAHMGAIIQQGIAIGRCPVTNRYEILSLLSWFVVLLSVIVYVRGRLHVMSVILTPLALVVLITSNLLEYILPARPLALGAAEEGSLFLLHVTIALVGVAALFLTFASSLTYLLQDRILKSKQHGSWLRVLPPLDRCDRLVYQSLMLGFPLLTLGIVTGSLLSASRNGHFWPWRADEAFSVTAWAIFAVIIYARLARGWRGRKSAYLTIAGFVAGVLTMIGLYV